MPLQLAGYKRFVILAALLAPVMGGAIIYYSLRKSHRDIADLAKATSLVGFAAWMFVWNSGVIPSRHLTAGVYLTTGLPLMLTVSGLFLSLWVTNRIKR